MKKGKFFLSFTCRSPPFSPFPPSGAFLPYFPVLTAFFRKSLIAHSAVAT